MRRANTRLVRSTPFQGCGGAGDLPGAAPAPGGAGFSRRTPGGCEKNLDLAVSFHHLDSDGVVRLVGRRDMGPLDEIFAFPVPEPHARLEVARLETSHGEHQIDPSIGVDVEGLGLDDAVLAVETDLRGNLDETLSALVLEEPRRQGFRAALGREKTPQRARERRVRGDET